MKTNIFMNLCKNIISEEAYSALCYAQAYNLQQEKEEEEIYKFVDAFNELIEGLNESIFKDLGVLNLSLLEVPTSCKPHLTYNGKGLTVYFLKIAGIGIQEEFIPLEGTDTIHIDIGLYDEGIIENTALATEGFTFMLAGKDFYI